MTNFQHSIKSKELLTQNKLKQVLNYDPDTGIFTWKVNLRRGYQGKIAGCVVSQGYLHISINGNHYKAHRLAWLYIVGRWPEKQIDHINCQKNDNRWINLREADYRLNGENRNKAQKNNKTGVLGTTLTNRNLSNPWCARIRIEGKLKNLGYFGTPEEAQNAYIEAKRKYHKGNTL